MADTKISALPSATTPLGGTEILPIVQSGTTDNVSVANLTAGRDVAMRNLTMSQFATYTSITQSRAQGTSASPTPVANGQTLAQWNANGYTTSGGYRTGAYIAAAVSAGVSGDELPTTVYIATTADGATSPTNRVSISHTGDTNVLTGNLVIGTAGKGIDFSADSHAAGMTSELLNDYEEGTFTPTLSGSTGNPTGVAYGTQSGTYTKIGRMVSVYVQLTFTTYTGGSGNAQISGLPFTVGTNGRGPVNLYNATYTGYIVAGGSGTNIILFQNASGAGYTFVPLTGVPSSGTSKFIEVSLVYYV